MHDMITYTLARDIIEDAARQKPATTEWRATDRLAGCVAAETVTAPCSIQPFDNSAMDGFAVRLSDFPEDAGAGVTLLRRDTLAAGDNAEGTGIAPGECMAIMTGAPVPEGTDAVVPVERTEKDGDRVIFHARPGAGDNIRRAGEDFREGDPVWRAGERLGPAQLMAAATLGISGARVFRPLRAAFIATGKELVDDFSQPLAPGQIYNSNRFYAEQALKQLGVELVSAHTIHDERAVFHDTVKELIARGIDIVISSGAVSAGEFDFVRDELESLDAEILFHRLRIKPGKPNLFARLPHGGVYFGLPGNPVATVVGLRFFVAPFLDAACGRPPEAPVKARLANRVKKRGPLRIFLKARADMDDGQLRVTSLEGQASFMVSPMLSMNVWAIAPEDQECLEAGSEIEIYPEFPDDRFPQQR